MFKNYKRKYLYFFSIFLSIIFFIFVLIFFNKTQYSKNDFLVQQYSTGNLNKFIATYKIKKNVISRKININPILYYEKDTGLFKVRQGLDHYIYFFLYLCDNQDKIEKYYREIASDEELKTFLAGDEKCRVSILDGMYENSLKYDKETQEFLFNECGVNREETQKYKYFERMFQPTKVLMASYYLGYENKDNVLKYLDKFKNISGKDQNDYFYFLEKEYSAFYYDFLNGENIDYDKCQSYLTNDKIIINEYLEKGKM